jgi:Tfp pilus assembly protein PilO
MTQWWEITPMWHRMVFFGLGVVLLVMGMQTWVWSSLDNAIAILTQDIASLTKRNQEALKNIESLKGVEGEVPGLREKLFSRLQHITVGGEPQDFRREMMDIGKRTGVSVRLWSPQTKMNDDKPSEASLDINVRVEGSFFGTVQFLDELLQLSWIQTVNPLVLVRKQDSDDASLVITEFTIKMAATHRFQQAKDMLKT